MADKKTCKSRDLMKEKELKLIKGIWNNNDKKLKDRIPLPHTHTQRIKIKMKKKEEKKVITKLCRQKLM